MTLVDLGLLVAYIVLNLLELNGISGDAYMIVSKVNWNLVSINVWTQYSASSGRYGEGFYSRFNWSLLVLLAAIVLNFAVFCGFHFRRVATAKKSQDN
jgi:hypothetical protein